MAFDFTDEMLKKAVIKADRYEMDALPSDEQIEHRFSHKFQENMKRLIRQSRRNTLANRLKTGNKRLVAGFVVMIMLFASAMSVSGMRLKVFEFITEMHEKYTHIFFKESQPSQTSNEDFTVYMPTYIPEGFKLVHKDTDGAVLLEYEKNNDFISYEQTRLDEISMHINTEGVELEELKFNNLPARYYSNQGVQNLIWYDDHYMYTVSSTLDRKTVFKIAESVKLKEN